VLKEMDLFCKLARTIKATYSKLKKWRKLLSQGKATSDQYAQMENVARRLLKVSFHDMQGAGYYVGQGCEGTHEERADSHAQDLIDNLK
jgi:hypothetical protein